MNSTEAVSELINSIKSYSPSSIDLLKQAYDFATKAHEGQFRKSGEPFISHPVAVAQILADLELDHITIIAGILHDVVEDTDVSLAQIQKAFGNEIALLVDGVTKLSKIEYRSKEERQAESLRKMFMAMAKDIRVILIKLADRTHNMRTLTHQSEKKQKEIARETLEIYAPLANRLGIFRLKWELEDLAFRYLNSESYYELVDGISKKRHEREAYINQVIEILSDKLEELNISADIIGRPKHFYSIYKKMVQQQKPLNEIYDLIAVRVLVDSVKDCYGVLGTIHTLWKPIPGRFKDYIAMPKSNMYQSLHTTVIGPGGDPFEIQIRTWDMHRTAEYGIAAHWKYKEGVNTSADSDKKLAWLRQLLEWQHELRDAKEFMEHLKIDLFDESVFVFTPKGDVLELPAGSVPLDFAYRVHTDVGHKCVGAKINGKIVPINYRLQNGDILEILTSKQSNGPSRDWLKLVQTSQAKNKIRAWFKKEKREENIEKGKEILEKEFRKLNLDPAEHLKIDKVEDVLNKFNFTSMEDLLIAIAAGVITPHHVLAKYKAKPIDKKLEELLDNNYYEDKDWKGGGKANKGILVKGIDNLAIRLARCCSPVPGDKIVGYITRGRGVSVHRKDCSNITSLEGLDGSRMIEVAWDNNYHDNYPVLLEILAMDRAGLLQDVLAIISDMKMNALSVSARATKHNMATIDLTLQIKGTEHLQHIINKILKVKDVYEIKRIESKQRNI